MTLVNRLCTYCEEAVYPVRSQSECRKVLRRAVLSDEQDERGRGESFDVGLMDPRRHLRVNKGIMLESVIDKSTVLEWTIHSYCGEERSALTSLCSQQLYGAQDIPQSIPEQWWTHCVSGSMPGPIIIIKQRPANPSSCAIPTTIHTIYIYQATGVICWYCLHICK